MWGRSLAAAVTRQSESLVINYLPRVWLLTLPIGGLLTPLMVMSVLLVVPSRQLASDAAAAPLPAFATVT